MLKAGILAEYLKESSYTTEVPSGNVTGGENETDSAFKSPELEGLGGAVFDNDDPNTLSRPESVAINYFVIMLLYSKHLKTIITGKAESFGLVGTIKRQRLVPNITYQLVRPLAKALNQILGVRVRGKI